MDSSLGVYVHVPFCAHVCPYCDFAVEASGSGGAAFAATEKAYVDALLAELALRRDAFAGRSLASVYFGGGTPSLLRPDSLARIREAVEAGANGYLVKSVDADSLARAVRSAAAGQSAFSAEVTQALTSRASSQTLESLTSRESEIAELVAEGRTNAEIAQQCGLSIFTVKNHVSSILMKLHVQSRTEAASVILKSRNT